MENHSCRSMQDVHDSHAVSLPLFHDRSRWSSQSLLRLIQNLGFFLQTPKVNRQKYYKLWKSYQPLHLHELELCVCSGDLAGWWKTPIFIKEPTITISSDAVWKSDKTLCFEAIANWSERSRCPERAVIDVLFFPLISYKFVSLFFCSLHNQNH